MSEEKICKCGHMMDSHIKKRKLSQKLKITGYCEHCPCTLYMNRNRPDKIDKILCILGSGLLAMFIFAGCTTIMISDQAKGMEPIKLPADVVLVLTGVLIFIGGIYITPTTFEYFDLKERKSWPVSENP